MPPAFPRDPGKSVTKSPVITVSSPGEDGPRTGRFVAVGGYVRALEWERPDGTFAGRLEDVELVTGLYRAWAKHGGDIVLVHRENAAATWVVGLAEGNAYAFGETVFGGLGDVPRETLAHLPDESTVTPPPPDPRSRDAATGELGDL